ncbi:MAG: hypothetical protein ABSG81_07410 [Acidimicrobiales bacterium]
MSDDATGDDGSPLPRLTIGQRLLTTLPSLQRGHPAPETDEVDGDTETDDVAEDSGTEQDRPVPRSRQAATRSSARPTARQRQLEAMDSLSREDIVRLIKKVDDRERVMALFSAPLGVAVGVALTVIAIHTYAPLRVNGHVNKQHVAESLILLEGGARVLLSGLVAVAAMSRRRSFIGFALLFLGTSMGSPLFALPFWALGGYLIWRVFKYQRALNARNGTTRGAGRPARGGRVPANPKGAARAGAAAGRDRAATARDRAVARQRNKKQPAPPGPPPSKRYTPPRPTRPRPPAPPPT